MFAVAKAIEAGGKELQDRAEFFRHDSSLVVVIADGAGGMGGAAEAAEYLVCKIKNAISNRGVVFEDLENFLIALDREMAATTKFGESTCIVASITEEKVSGVSVGDSGAWIIDGTETYDLTAAQVRKPLMASGRATPTPFWREWRRGTVLLASDGLLKYASRERIASVVALPDLDDAAKRLIELVRYASGALPDDISVVLVRK
jgi:serine/threonine protein phosphatase PrpC